MSKTDTKSKQGEQLASLQEEALGSNKKPEKIHLGDTASLKRALDDAAIEALEEQDFRINHAMMDIKIGLGFLACVVACAAQFWPGKYPETRPVLILCIVAYALLTLALTGMQSFVEKDTFAKTKATTDRPALVLRSSMPRFQDNYTLAVRPRGTMPGSSAEVKLVSSVGAFFDADGILAGRGFKVEVIKLVGKVGTSQSGGEKKSQ